MARNGWTFLILLQEFQPHPSSFAGGLYYGGQWEDGIKLLFLLLLLIIKLRFRSIL